MNVLKYFSLVLVSSLLAHPVYAQKEQAALFPLAVVGDISAGQQGILFNTFQERLADQFNLVSEKQFEQAQDEAFKTLDAEECTEDQCIRRVQEILQVENLFRLQIIREGDDTQLTVTRIGLEDKNVKTYYCQKCNTFQLNGKISELVAKVIGENAPQPTSEETGQVFLTSTPPEAEITLDGIVLEQKTPALLKAIPYGEHTLDLRHENLGITQTFKLTSSELTRLDLTLAPLLYNVLITSTPYNAEVSVDQKPVGKAPVDLKLTSGRHLVEIRLTGYAPFTQNLEVDPQIKNTLLEAKLKRFGTLEITTLPAQAHVFLEGIAKGETPVKLQVTEGTHQLKIQKTKYETLEKTLTVQGGKTTKYKVTLVKIPELIIGSTPGGAKIMVDQQVVGNTPLTLQTTKGPHQIQIEKEGFEVFQKQLQVATEDVSLAPRLAPIQGRLTLRGCPQGSVITLTGGTYVPATQTLFLPVEEKQLPIGPYTLKVTHQEYVPVEKSFEILPNQQTLIDIKMELRPSSLKLTIIRDALVEDEDGHFVVNLIGKESWNKTDNSPDRGIFALEVESGTYELYVTHSSHKYVEQKQALVLKPGETFSQEIHLELTDYYQARQSWKWKWRSSLGVTLISTGLLYATVTAVENANTERQQLSDKIKTAKTLHDAQAYRTQEDEKMAEIATMKEQTQGYLGLTLGLAALTGWLYWDEPEPPSSSAISWHWDVHPQGKVQLSFNKKW
ncbi:PEGA domain-containing protein [Deltaproteobacteria bacterium TL4]